LSVEKRTFQNIDGVGEAIATHTASPAELPFSDQPLQPTSSESLHDCVRLATDRARKFPWAT
jgi:hypothetical protein